MSKMKLIGAGRQTCVFVLVLTAVGLFAAAPAALADPPAAVSHFAVPTANAQPQGIAVAPDGSIWFTENHANQIGEVTPSGAVNEYAIPTLNSGPEGIAVAPDGSVWFTESTADQIGKLTPGGSVNEYPIPTATSDPDQITIGPDDDPWFTETGADKIGTVAVATGTVTEYPLPQANSEPEGITTSTAGTIWFTEAGDRFVGTISTTGTIVTTQLPTTIGFAAIATDAAGNVWLTRPSVSGGPESGVLELAGGSPLASEEFLPQGSNPSAIAIGPDGAAWFTETGSGQIARITYVGAGGITGQFATGGSPADIVAGPGNTLWFTDPTNDTIGRAALTAPAITSPPTVTLTAGQAANVTITTSGFPFPALNETGSLPGGVSFSDNGNGTATITGTASTADQGATFPVTLTASGFGPTGSQALSIEVTAPPASPTVPPSHTTTTKPTTTTRYGTATAGRPRVTGTVVTVEVACRGTSGHTCAIIAALTGHRAGRRAATRNLARKTITLKAGHHRTLELKAAPTMGKARAEGLRVVTLTVVQRARKERTLRRRRIVLSRR
jgi:virginiamycin B lyase